MILDAKLRRYSGKLPQEFLDFVRRQHVNGTCYRGGEQRRADRHLMMIAAFAVCVDANNEALGDPFEVITRDVTASSIGLFHVDQIRHTRLALHMTLAETEVDLVVSLAWSSPKGPFYGSGGVYVGKLRRFPCDWNCIRLPEQASISRLLTRPQK